MSTQPIGAVLSIALRSTKRGPMREVSEAAASAGGWLEGDPRTSEHRGITLIAAKQWAAVVRELGTDLPWHTRRANVLVDCDGLLHLVGKTIAVGDVRVQVVAETDPCGLMDQFHQGLREALVPDGRGGVHGRILNSGTIRVGDTVVIDNGA